MPLNVEIENADAYDAYLMRKILNIKEIQNAGRVNYVIENSALESMLSIKKNPKGPLRFDSKENTKETIDIIITPYMHEGKKVSVDGHGMFKEPEYGVFLIEVRPKHDNIGLKVVPSGAITFTGNYEHTIMKFSSNITTYNNMPIDVMINLFYVPKAAQSSSTQVVKPKIETGLDNIAA